MTNLVSFISSLLSNLQQLQEVGFIDAQGGRQLSQPFIRVVPALVRNRLVKIIGLPPHQSHRKEQKLVGRQPRHRQSGFMRQCAARVPGLHLVSKDEACPRILRLQQREDVGVQS
jgi:hypothetical protein